MKIHNGYYGNFGGAFIPEMLHPYVKELQDRYLDILTSNSFKKEWSGLLKEYAGRPTALTFCANLSAKYGYRIFLKREDLCHTGAHKINNALGQILLAKRLGKKHVVAETGAGQHGVAVATSCARLKMNCVVYMGEVDMDRQDQNVARMKMLGADVRKASSGSRTLKDATNEAIRHWINHPKETHYAIGSAVGPHPYPDMVARFQSVISTEIREQIFQKTGKSFPNAILACVGGGSNAMGTYYDFLHDDSVRLIAVEASGEGLETGKTAASIALGRTGVLHGSKTIFMQTDDGQVVEPYSISAGLDYPGIGPQLAHLSRIDRVEFHTATDLDSLQAGMEMSQLEGIIPALETAHALSKLGHLSLKRDETLVVCLSGRGDKDLLAYKSYYEQKQYE